ncbi:hypothetical protein SUGI_0454230 [Cryptomeria japonica]|nr:hypothetical protein SUGI_0454230 [Cryptomeria japonica]
MPNLLNKDKNKKLETDEWEAAQKALILEQRVERRRRLRQLAEGRPAEGLPEGNQGGVTEGAEAEGNFYASPDYGRARSLEEFLEETRLQRELVEETRDRFKNLSLTPQREDHRRESGTGDDEGEANRTVGTRQNTVPSVTTTGDISGIGGSNHTVGTRQNTVPSVTTTGDISDIGGSSAGGQRQPQPPPSGRFPSMATKQKLPKFNGDSKDDPARHCRTCETIWTANGVTDQDEWMKQFPATLRGVAIDWYSDLDKTGVTTWDELKKAFEKEFRLLRDDNEIVSEIYGTKQGKKETVRAYGHRLKELVGKMESQPADGLKKRWFVEGLNPKLRRKMKIVPLTSYDDAYNRAMDLESENKTAKKKKNRSSSSSEDDTSEEESSSDEKPKKKITALQKDMERMLKEFKTMKGTTGKDDELWCTDCKESGHTKGACPKKVFCDICQIMGHSTKECPYNLKAHNQQVLFAHEQPSTSDSNNNASSGGYRGNR